MAGLADLLAEIPDEPPRPLATARSEALAPRDPADAIRAIEDRVLQKAITVVEHGLAWADIDMGAKDIPDEWLAEVGIDEARKRHRVALAAQMNAKEAPVGLKLAKEVFVGVVKARATERAAPRALNIERAVVQFQVPEYPRLKVDR